VIAWQGPPHVAGDFRSFEQFGQETDYNGSRERKPPSTIIIASAVARPGREVSAVRHKGQIGRKSEIGSSKSSDILAVWNCRECKKEKMGKRKKWERRERVFRLDEAA
jgi:hypothetical protein